MGPCGSGSSVRRPVGISLQNVHKRNPVDERTDLLAGGQRLKRPNPPLERVLWRLEHAIRKPYSVAPHVSFLDSSPPPCLLALCLRPWRSVPRFRRWRPRFSIPTTGIAFLRPSSARRPAGAWGDRRRRPQVGLRSGPWKPFRRRGLRGRRTRARPDESGSPVSTGPPRTSSIQNRYRFAAVRRRTGLRVDAEPGGDPVADFATSVQLCKHQQLKLRPICC